MLASRPFDFTRSTAGKWTQMSSKFRPQDRIGRWLRACIKMTADIFRWGASLRARRCSCNRNGARGATRPTEQAQTFQYSFVGTRKRQLVQFRKREPALLERRAPTRQVVGICSSCRAGARRSNAKRLHRNSIPCDRVFNGAKRFRILRRKSKQPLHGSRLVHWLTIQLHIRKLPKMRIHHACWSLPHQKLSAILDHKRRKPSRRRRWPLVQIREFIHAIILKCKTMFCDRTNQTLRLARRANQRTQFHQRLVEVRAG